MLSHLNLIYSSMDAKWMLGIKQLIGRQQKFSGAIFLSMRLEHSNSCASFKKFEQIDVYKHVNPRIPKRLPTSHPRFHCLK